MEMKDLVNKEVLDSHGNIVGKIVDVSFEIPPGKLSYLVVKGGTGLMGGKKQNVPADQIASIGDKVILSVPWETPVTADKSS